MADERASLVERAWKALWRADSRYYFPTILEKGVTTARLRVAPLRFHRFPDVGPLTLFNREPWNGVAIWLLRNRVTLTKPPSPLSFQYDASTGRFTAEIALPGLEYSAHYLVRAGMLPRSSMQVAAETLGLDAGDPSGNITLAKSYQDNLLASDNGITLVGTYWDNNEAYHYVFTNSTVLQTQWKNTQTPAGSGQTSLFFANQTNSAAQPGQATPPPVQGVVSSNGYSHYGAHSAIMQNFVWQTCLAYADHTTGPISSQLSAAGAVSSQFLAASQNYVGTPMTVPNVMSTVAGGSRSLLAATAPAPRPAWQADVEDRGRSFRAEVEEEIRTRGTARPAPYHPHRLTPARGTVAHAFDVPCLSVAGTVETDADGRPHVRFAAPNAAGVRLDLKLTPFEGELYGEVSRAVADADFLKDALGRRAEAALGGDRMLNALGSVMTLALGGELGPVTG